MKVTLRKIKSTHSRLTEDVFEGDCVWLPVIGEGFLVYAPSLILRTSPVVSIEGNVFKTLNSTYELTVHE